MRIGGILPFSSIDYPDKICSVVFLAGCNFRCPFCFNRELVLKNGKKAEIQDILKEIERNKDFVDAVCISGGEPCLQRDLPDLCRALKEHGFLVKLDTNGSNPGMLRSLIRNGLLDYVAMDIKTSLKNYKPATKTNVDVSKIKESISILKSFSKVEFRTTLVKGLHKKQDIEDMAGSLKHSRLVLQYFVPGNCLDPKYNKKKPFSEEEMTEFKRIAGRYTKCEIRESPSST